MPELQSFFTLEDKDVRISILPLPGSVYTYFYVVKLESEMTKFAFCD